jgi:hypothetical protein
MEEAQ